MFFDSINPQIRWPEDLAFYLVDQVVIYADGSCYYKTGDGAYAARVEYHVTEDRLGEDRYFETVAKHYVWDKLTGVTNNIAELKAIYHGLLAIPQHMGKDVVVTVYSDSEWAIRCLTGQYNPTTYHDHPVITWSMIREQEARFKQVNWKHVMGHSGLLGNEECDTLCTAVRNGVLVTEKVFNELMQAAARKSR